MPRLTKISEPIDSKKFRCTQWTTTVGLEQTRLVLQSAAPALAQIRAGAEPEALTMQVILGISQNVSSDTFEKLKTALVDSLEMEVGGAWVPLASVFDDMFAGKLVIVLKILAFAFKIQFADFFDLLLVGGQPSL